MSRINDGALATYRTAKRRAWVTWVIIPEEEPKQTGAINIALGPTLFGCPAWRLICEKLSAASSFPLLSLHPRSLWPTTNSHPSHYHIRSYQRCCFMVIHTGGVCVCVCVFTSHFHLFHSILEPSRNETTTLTHAAIV